MDFPHNIASHGNIKHGACTSMLRVNGLMNFGETAKGTSKHEVQQDFNQSQQVNYFRTFSVRMIFIAHINTPLINRSPQVN